MPSTDIIDFSQAVRELDDLYEAAVRNLEAAEARGDVDGAAAAESLRRKIFRAQDDLAINGLAGLARKLDQFRAELEALNRRARAWPFPSTDTRTIPTRRPSPSNEPGGGGDVPDAPPVGNMDAPGPIPPGPPSAFIRARKIAAKTILYIDTQGREFIKEGGSRSWRNYNPGNIRKGNFASAAGGIGDDDAFAIFPDLKTGLDAIVALLRSNSYVNLSLKEAVFRYAPPNENDSEQYAAFLERETGIAGSTVLSTLTVADIRKIAKVIQTVEGWQPGIERANTPTSVSNAGVAVSSAAGAASDWMDLAKREAALPELERSQWADPGENPRILNYFRIGSSWFEPVEGDEVDWCAAFVNYCLVTAGYIGTDHPGARSFFWNKKNQFVKLDQPRYGAVAVRRYAPFTDPTWATGQGHVGFVHLWTPNSVTLLGGNQSGTVKPETYPLVKKDSTGKITAQFVAFMMPVMN